VSGVGDTKDVADIYAHYNHIVDIIQTELEPANNEYKGY
jgi:hypothetical protein